MMSIAGSAASRLCMMMTGAPCSATTRAMSGSRCRPQTSLTIAAPASSAQAATRGLDACRSRPECRCVATAGRIGASRCAFFLERHRPRAAIGPRRFRADVDDVGALGGKPPRLLDRRRRLEETAAVGKRIRRDIENAHDQRRGLWPKARASTLPPGAAPAPERRDAVVLVAAALAIASVSSSRAIGAVALRGHRGESSRGRPSLAQRSARN